MSRWGMLQIPGEEGLQFPTFRAGPKIGVEEGSPPPTWYVLSRYCDPLVVVIATI